LEAYKDCIDCINKKHGYIRIDMVSVQPDNPNAAAARGKFLSEHTHDDFETRLFVDGQGIFLDTLSRSITSKLKPVLSAMARLEWSSTIAVLPQDGWWRHAVGGRRCEPKSM
jgi:hypothetical protein